MRAYLRLDPQLVEKTLTARYTPSQVCTFVMLLTQAEHQPKRGRFRTLGLLREALDAAAERAGKGARLSQHLSFLIDQGDVVQTEQGWYVDGWDEWQEGDWKVAERVTRIRARQRAARVTAPTVTTATPNGVTPDTAPGVNTPSEH